MVPPRRGRSLVPPAGSAAGRERETPTLRATTPRRLPTRGRSTVILMGVIAIIISGPGRGFGGPALLRAVARAACLKGAGRSNENCVHVSSERAELGPK